MTTAFAALLYLVLIFNLAGGDAGMIRGVDTRSTSPVLYWLFIAFNLVAALFMTFTAFN